MVNNQHDSINFPDHCLLFVRSVEQVGSIIVIDRLLDVGLIYSGFELERSHPI